MLLLVGVAFPVLAAVGLWKNRKRLDEWDFAWKVRVCTLFAHLCCCPYVCMHQKQP